MPRQSNEIGAVFLIMYYAFIESYWQNISQIEKIKWNFWLRQKQQSQQEQQYKHLG